MTTEELFASHLRLAYLFAGRKASRCPPDVYRDMLLGPALEGLWRAAHDFDPERGYAFSTYAARRMTGSMQDFLRTLDVVTRRQPGVDYPEVCSLDAIPVELAADEVTPLDKILNVELRDILLEGISWLEKRDQDVLIGTFFEGRTQVYFSELWGVNGPRVTQIKNRALVRLADRIDLSD